MGIQNNHDTLLLLGVGMNEHFLQAVPKAKWKTKIFENLKQFYRKYETYLKGQLNGIFRVIKIEEIQSFSSDNQADCVLPTAR